MKAIGHTFAFFAVLIATIVTCGAAAKSGSAAVHGGRCLNLIDCRPRSSLSNVDHTSLLTMVDQKSQLVSQSQMIDHSRKGDRLDAITAAIKARPPIGCESAFSPLANLPRPNIARCVT
jgi:hypothetical protein